MIDAQAEPPRSLGNVPDQVESQLQESEQQIDGLFSFGPEDWLHEGFDSVNGCLREAARIDLGLNYTSVYQHASSATGPNDALGGDVDFFGSWLATGNGERWPGRVVFNTEARHRLADIPPAGLGTGTAGGTIVAFGTQDFSMVQLYWNHGSYEDGAQYRVGKMDPALLYDGGRYVSSNYAFLSPFFSDTLPMPLPGAGLGLAAATYPFEDVYVLAGIHDANGRRSTSGFDTTFGEGELFTAIEFGATPGFGEPGEGLYHLTLWHVDPRENAGRRSDRGIALTLEQEVGREGNIVPFLRYAWADVGLNGIRQNLAVGVGFENVLRQNDDVIGFAAAWGEPSGAGLDDQYVLEVFSRIYVTEHTHISPDVQIVFDPATAPTADVVTILGVRLRTLF